MKIFGDELNPSVPYKTFLLSLNDTAEWVVKEMLNKYGMKYENPITYCLSQVTIIKVTLYDSKVSLSCSWRSFFHLTIKWTINLSNKLYFMIKNVRCIFTWIIYKKIKVNLFQVIRILSLDFYLHRIDYFQNQQMSYRIHRTAKTSSCTRVSFKNLSDSHRTRSNDQWSLSSAYRSQSRYSYLVFPLRFQNLIATDNLI